MIEPLLIMFMLCIVVPVAAILLIGLPVYGGMFASLYWVYQPNEDWVPHPLSGRFWEIETMVAQYLKLLDHGGLTLQMTLPPMVGVIVAAGLVFLFYRYVRGQFTVDSL